MIEKMGNICSHLFVRYEKKVVLLNQNFRQSALGSRLSSVDSRPLAVGCRALGSRLELFPFIPNISIELVSETEL